MLRKIKKIRGLTFKEISKKKSLCAQSIVLHSVVRIQLLFFTLVVYPL